MAINRHWENPKEVGWWPSLVNGFGKSWAGTWKVRKMADIGMYQSTMLLRDQLSAKTIMIDVAMHVEASLIQQ